MKKFSLGRDRLVASVVSLLFVVSVSVSCVSQAPTAPAPKAAVETYDVIVVGAGLAGLTTAKELMKAHRSVVVLEATDRIGGRAMTNKSFSVPIDFGAAWIHGVPENPLTPVVEAAGFHRAPSKLDGPVFIGSERLSAERQAEFEKALEDTHERMEKASEAGRDEAASLFLPEQPADFRALIGSNIGPLESSAEITKTSSADSAAFKADPDDFIREGVGTFVEQYGSGVPVKLRSAATIIHYGPEAGGGVVVDTSAGTTYRARRVVVTVSTGVLNAHRIAFSPDLPAWKWTAIQKLPMGLLNKVVFQFPGPILPEEHDSEWVLYQRPQPKLGPEPEVMAFVIKPMGANIIVGFYGAGMARRFEELGDKPAADYAKAALTDMYGAGLVAQIQNEKTKVTHWGQTSWTFGAYSAALPGASKEHDQMAKPVGDKVFFAGEACGPAEFNGSLAAAYLSGLKASAAVQESLAREGAATPAEAVAEGLKN